MTTHRSPLLSRRQATLIAVGFTLLAFAVRVWQLDAVPPGWNDDELSNALVLAQKVLDGDLSVYYVDATGHEAGYHFLAAGFIALFGYNVIGIRLLSAILGTLTVPLTYQVGRRLFGREAGLLAAAALAVSFWSLVYSRNGQRHVSFPVFMLASFYFFWKGLQAGNQPAGGDKQGPGWLGGRSATNSFLAAGLFMGLGFYTYFASRGVPLILLAFVGFLWLFHRPLIRRRWRGILLTFGVALLLAVPLVVKLIQAPGADARVAEVAVPLVEARAGNLDPLREHVVRTLSMFHADGDDEFLYNIPHRPVFGPFGALLFWSGVLIALWYAGQPLWRALRSPSGRENGHPAGDPRSTAAAFLLLWWLAGITPAFLSVPPGSLGHTIAAQSATYLLAALPISLAARRRGWLRRLAPILALVLIATVAARDLPDYFQEWPQRGNVRFLYHAWADDVAAYLSQQPEAPADFGISGLLAGPWDRLALQIEMENAGVKGARPRWFDPRRAVLLQTSGEPALLFTGYPRVETAYTELYAPLPGETAGEYVLARVETEVPDPAESVCFRNGLCLLEGEYDTAAGRLHLTWEVARPLNVPAVPVVSKPAPPGVYDGPRLAVFAQLLAGDEFLTGEDGLWVNPETLRPGDVFRQQHHLAPPSETSAATPTDFAVGLYDPLTGERILTEAGDDHVRLNFPAP